MRLSFDDEESFKEAAGSLHFNNPPSDPDSLQRERSRNSLPPQERNDSEDSDIQVCVDNPPLASDPNILQVLQERNKDT